MNLPSTSYVSPGGHDTGPLAGARGQIERPFLTVGAAVAAALSGDAIYVSPGNYFEDIVVDVLNPGITSLAFLGAGFESNVSSISWTMPLNATYFRASNLRISGAGTSGKSLLIDATASIPAAKAYTDGVLVESGARFLRSALVKLDSLQSSLAGALAGSQVEVLDCTDLYLGGNSVLNWGLLLGFANGAATDIALGTYTVKESTIFSSAPSGNVAALTITGCPTVFIDTSVRLASGGGPDSVDATGLTSDLTNGLAPDIRLAASCDEDVTITFSPALGGSQNRADLSRGQFYGRDVTIGCNAPDATGVLAFAQNANFSNGVTAGQSTTFDIRSSFYYQANLQRTDDGTIDRDQHTIIVAFDSGPNQTQGIVPPYPGTLGDSDFNTIFSAHLAIPGAGTLMGALGASNFTGAGEVSLVDIHAANAPNTPATATATITRSNT